MPLTPGLLSRSARRKAVKETIALFNIQPPAGTLAKEGKILNSIGARGQSVFTTIRSSTPYSTRAGSGEANSAPAPASSPNDWTILGLVLPQPSGLARFSSENINGAVAHTAMLLKLLSATLGIMLPFKIEQQGGQYLAQPNQYWDEAGKQLRPRQLHLSESAHATLVPRAESRSAALRHGATDMAASAISTMGSFVKLGQANWHTGAPGRAEDPQPAAAGPEREKQSASEASKVIQKFKLALMMLTYDAAFLAETQGALIDAAVQNVSPSRAAVPLRLLAHLAGGSNVGKRSHNAMLSQGCIREFEFPRLSFTDLCDYFEPLAPATNKAAAIVMEGSYIDAAADAQSIILRDRTTKPAAPGSSASRSSKPAVADRQQVAKASSAGGPTATARPSDLEFLRQKGKQISRPAAPSTSKPTSRVSAAEASKSPSRGSPVTQPTSKAATPSKDGPIIADGTIKIDGKKLMDEVKQRSSRSRDSSGTTPPPARSKSKGPEEPHRGTVLFNGRAL